jgi:iron only hydrogenase large subunit-like protein
MHSPPHAPSKYRSGSSGLLEYVFRSMAKDRFGVGLDDGSPLPYKQVRNRDFQTVALAIDGKTVLNCAAVYGFRNIQSIIRQLKKGKCPYDFVEVMACPGGCLNGGGQPAAPLVAFSESEDGVAAVEPGAIATQRAKDAHLVEVVKKHESLIVQAPEKDSVAEIVDKEWLRAAEGIITTNQLRGKVLHTRYHAVPKMESGLGQSW